MNIKQFLKPNKRKIMAFVVLFILSLLISFPVGLTLYSDYSFGFNFAFCKDGINFGYCEEFHGFPFVYTTYGKNDVVLPQTLENTKYENIFGVVFNLIFWYILSCFIVWIYDKTKKVKRK